MFRVHLNDDVPDDFDIQDDLDKDDDFDEDDDDIDEEDDDEEEDQDEDDDIETWQVGRSCRILLKSSPGLTSPVDLLDWREFTQLI